MLLTDDDLAGESRYEELMPEVVDRLGAAGLLEESDGAQVVFPPGFTNREGEPLPLIVRSRAGAFTYATSDLACVIDRVERVRATWLLYVVGAPQAQHLAMVFAVADDGRLAGPADPGRARLVRQRPRDRPQAAQEPQRRAGAVHRRHRRGDRARAAPPSPRRTRSSRPSSAAAIGQQVGIGALKYADLSTDRVRDYVFDWERMLSFDGNTAPYLQYAHARICSIFRRAGVERADVRRRRRCSAPTPSGRCACACSASAPPSPRAVERTSPHRLCTYLYELASDFTAFYEHCPVLKAPMPAPGRVAWR